MFGIGLRAGWKNFHLVPNIGGIRRYLQDVYYELNVLETDLKRALKRDEFEVDPEEFWRFFNFPDIYHLYLTLREGRLIGKHYSDSTYFYLENNEIRRYVIPLLKETQ